MPLIGWNGSVNGLMPGNETIMPAPSGNALMSPQTAVLHQSVGPQGRPSANPSPNLSGLLNTAQNFAFPMTSGLLNQAPSLINSLSQQPANVPNYSQIALQMAGNPHAGPYAQVAPPSGVGVPGAGSALGTSGGSSGSSWPSILGGLLGVLGNPSASQGIGNIASSVGGLLKGLLGSSGSSNSGLPAGGSYNSGIGAPIDISGLQNSNGYSSFDNFANSSGFDPVTGLYTPTTGDPYSFLGGDSSNPFGMNSGYDPTTGTYDSFDTGDPYSLFSGAGGQAAATNSGSGAASGYAPLGLDALNALGAYQGLTSGNPVGEAAGALDAAKLYGGATGDAAVGAGAGAGLGALGIYSGLQQGGVAGDTQAALGSAQLAGQAANAGYLGGSGAASALGTLGSVVGAVAPLIGAGIYAASTPSYTLGPQYYQRTNDSFNQLVANGINDPQFMANYDQLVNAQNATNADGESAAAAPLSPQQMQQLNTLYQQYLAKYMPQSALWNWSGNNPPAGPVVSARGNGGSPSYRSSQL